MKKPDILNPELEDSVTEPKLEQFKSRIEISEKDVEQVAGGVNPYCSVVL